VIEQVHIRGYKCLLDVRADLGMFNVIIGPNDSGKSSFLEVLGEPARWFVTHRSSRFMIMRQRGADPRLEMIGRSAAGVRLAIGSELQVRGHSSYGEHHSEHWAVPFEVGPKSSEAGTDVSSTEVPSHFTLMSHNVPAEMGALYTSEPIYVDPQAITRASPRGSGSSRALIESRGRGTAAHLAKVSLGERRRYDAIQTALREITHGRVKEFVVGEDTGEGYPLSFRLHDDTIIPASDLSQGLLVYLFFLALVHRDDAPAVLLIEEPENGLHPHRLQEVVTLLRTLTEHGTQIVLTTHSPDLLSACKPEEVLVFLRPDVTDGTQIHRLPADFERRAMRETLGQLWASRGEEGLLDVLPRVRAAVSATGGQ
jgi:Fe-S cluster assembly ATPase SufC